MSVTALKIKSGDEPVLPEVGVLGPPPEESGRRTNLAFRKLKVLAWAAVRGVVGVVVAGGRHGLATGLEAIVDCCFANN